jgi:ABC-type sugar transport system ATPase subunit
MSIIEAQSLQKSYGGTKALAGVDFTLEAGSVHALLGENGAGKSTLVKILSGAIKADAGVLRFDGSARTFNGTQQAKESGIAWVAQELSLFPDLDILANLFPNTGPNKSIFMDRKTREELARPVMDSLNLNHSTRKIVGELTLAERQLVEISRALIQKPKVLILDEPTSALERGNSDRLIEILHVMRDSGVGVIFVSHILQEVLDLCDTVTVLRDGHNAITGESLKNHNVESIVDAMVGDRRVKISKRRAAIRTSDISTGKLEFESVSTDKSLKGVTIEVCPGEIVGITGLVGSGHEDILQVAVGRKSISQGKVTMPDGNHQPKNLIESAHRGIAYVSGDRKKFGLMMDKSLTENIAEVRDFALLKDGWIMKSRRMKANAQNFVDKLSIRTPSVSLAAGSLSGGNQQKVVFAKWLNSSPSVLLLDDPTRGVDVGAKSEMHKIIEELTLSQIPVLMNSTDLEELASICDRVYVFKNGAVKEQVAGEDLDVSKLLMAMN